MSKVNLRLSANSIEVVHHTSVRLQVEQNQLVAVFIGIVLGIGGFECPWNGRFLEERDAENL